MKFQIMIGAALIATAVLGAGSEARAQAGDTLSYACGRSPGITISVNPMAGKGTFADATAQGEFARAALVPDQKGAWVNNKLGIMFFPESRPPKVSAGDAEFSCSQKAAAAAPAPAGTVSTYKCATIIVTIDSAKGTGSYKDASAPKFADKLTRKRDGSWWDKNEAAAFDPNTNPPTFSAGDAEFKCRKS